MPTPEEQSSNEEQDSRALQKAVLRRRFADYRRALSEEDYARYSAAIVARTMALPELRAAATVHLYWPLTARREVDTRPLAASLHEAGKTVVLPVVADFSRTAGTTPRLRHLALEGAAALRENRWGVHEPIGGRTVPVEEIDVVIVPALGAGRNGHRIGHGLGFYDEFLKTTGAPKIGLVYAACLVEAVPAEAHDVPLSLLVTEEEVVRPGPP